MKTNVKYISKDFFVNEAKKTVACKLTFDICLNNIPVFSRLLANDFDFYEELMSYGCDHENSWAFSYEEDDTFRVSVTRTAKCSGDDEFNEQFGKHLSLSKTQYEAFIIATNIYDMIYNYIEEKYLMPVLKLSDGAFDSFVKCENHITDLINSTK